MIIALVVILIISVVFETHLLHRARRAESALKWEKQRAAPDHAWLEYRDGVVTERRITITATLPPEIVLPEAVNGIAAWSLEKDDEVLPENLFTGRHFIPSHVVYKEL